MGHQEDAGQNLNGLQKLFSIFDFKTIVHIKGFK
jgi:hypothetical protein